jgi:hypothetical protein
MNNKFIFAVFFAITFIAYGCKENSNLGLDFLPEGDVLNLQITDTTTINVFTCMDDSLETNSPSQLLLGIYNDPIFGRVKAEFVSQILLDESSSFHPYYLDGIAESLIIYLPYDTTYSENFYGNKDAELQINVYKLSEPIYSDDIHYAGDNPDTYHDNVLVGSGILKSSDDNSLVITLDSELAQDFIDNSATYFSVSDTLAFTETFYGFYFSIVDDGVADGVIARFNPSSDDSEVVLSYYPLNDNDSLYKYNFQLNTSCVSFNLFSHTFSETVINNIDQNTAENQDSVAYLQSMGGTKIKLEFPYLSNLSTVENMILNKAELVVKTENSALSGESDFSAINYMTMVAYDNNNNLIYIDEFMNGSSLTGYEYSDGEYRFIITRQIEDFIINPDVSNEYSLYLVPLQRRYNFGRSVITTGNHSNSMKLILTYTQY